MTEPAAFLALLDQALAGARAGEAVELYGTDAAETTVRARDGAVDAVWQARVRGVGVRVVRDFRLGYAYTTDTSAAGLRRALAWARDNAALLPPDPGNALPAPLPAPPYPEADLYDPRAAAVTVARKAAAAVALDRAARRGRGVAVGTATYGDAVRTVAIASTAGVRAAYRRSDAYAAVEVIAGDGPGQVSAGGIATGRSLHAIDLEAVAAEARRRATRLVGARRVAGGVMPVVFDPAAAADLVAVLGRLVSAEACLRGRSLLAGRLGERVAAEPVTLVDDGRLPGGPRSAPWDGEGVPTQRTAAIDAGVLTGLLHSTRTAARAGARSTGNARRRSFKALPEVGASNLLLAPGPHQPAALLALAGTGFYCQSLMGVQAGVNPVTGELSCGAVGLMIRGGALAEPVREVTVAAPLLRLLRGVVAVAGDLKLLPGGAGGRTLLVEEVAVG